MKRTFLLFAVVFLLAGLLCPAQEAKPNFTGKWVLDTAKSDFGPVPGPSSRNDAIDHQDPKLKLTVTSKGQQGEFVTDQQRSRQRGQVQDALGRKAVGDRGQNGAAG